MEIFENIGTLIFAMSGAFIAINKKLDIFGIMFIGLVTSVGGGVLRDVILGNHPPALFQNPKFVIIAFFASIFAIIIYRLWNKNINLYLMNSFLALDAIGLGVFTIVGCGFSINAGYGENIFLTVFVGVTTGVGGGILRDILINRTPIILRKEIYAVPAIIGAIIYAYNIIPDKYSLIVCASIIAMIRLIALRTNFNMPHITKKGKK